MKLKGLITAVAAFCFLGATAQEVQNVRLPERPQKQEYKDYSTAESGYWTSVELSWGSTMRLKEPNVKPFGMAWVNGYRFSEKFRLGLGIGARYFINNDEVRTSDIPWAFPIYVNARGNIISHKDREIAPYWSADLGAEIRGGLYFAPSVGLRIGSPRHCALVALNVTVMQTDTWKKDKEILGALGVKVGYEF